MARNGTNDLRRMILDTAKKLLVEDGYQNLSMRKIANAIGYSATSIYLYFENKDDLVHALIDEGMEALYDGLSEAARKTEDAILNLRALCETYISFGITNPEYYEIMFQLHAERMARYPVEKYRRARRNIDCFGRAVEQGVQQGVFRQVPNWVAANHIWSSLHGMVSLLLARRFDVHLNMEELKAAIIEQILASFSLPRVSNVTA